MNNISIKVRIFLLCGLLSGFALLGTLFHLYRSREIYAIQDAASSRQVTQLAASAKMQLDFKKQIQEWKDILLRGRDPEALKNYTAAFFQQEAAVKKDAEELKVASGEQDLQ